MKANPDMNISQNPKLNTLSPMKQKIIMEISSHSQNRPIEELLPEVMKINQELNRRNMAFTKEESELLMDAIEETLSPQEKKSFAMIKSMMMGS
jgi:hypothetical protein